MELRTNKIKLNWSLENVPCLDVVEQLSPIVAVTAAGPGGTVAPGGEAAAARSQLDGVGVHLVMAYWPQLVCVNLN